MSTDPLSRPTRSRALLALLLLAPVPTIGIAAAVIFAPGAVGQAVFTVAKLWLVVFPAAWYLVMERGKPSWSPPIQGGIGTGTAVGITMAAAIVIGYWAIASKHVDPGLLRSAAVTMDLATLPAFVFAAAGWIFVNSVIEEYVYRWFVLRQLRALVPDGWAIAGSAAIFTVHHIVAVSIYLGPWMTALASLSVFLAGAVWSLLYLRYRSIWPGWISHAIADLAVFAIGGYLLFV